MINLITTVFKIREGSLTPGHGNKIFEKDSVRLLYQEGKIG